MVVLTLKISMCFQFFQYICVFIWAANMLPNSKISKWEMRCLEAKIS